MLHKVLLVEDDECIADLIRRYLETMNVVVVWLADGGEQFVRHALQTNPDIIGVLQDWNGTSRGLENCKRYYHEYTHLLVAVHSSGDCGAIRFILANAGISGVAVIEKPFHMSVLGDLVQGWVEIVLSRESITA